jgi:UDP-GlcNAc:undecaprenyl-phosphate GlcNAc-1-phosphate transferase
MMFVLVISTCNATNLLDGLDGLCGGVTGIIAFGFLALALYLASWGRYHGTDELRIAVCLAMAGAVLGFLPYNIPPASIFMGDAGSMLLGFFVATMMALFCREGNVRWVLAAGMVFALPILDTGLAVLRRLRKGVSIFTGDRSHLYDQLVDRGMTVKQVVALFYALATVAAVVGVVCAVYLRIRYAVIIYGTLLIGSFGLLWHLGMVDPNSRGRQGPAEDSDAPGHKADPKG